MKTIKIKIMITMDVYFNLINSMLNYLISEFLLIYWRSFLILFIGESYSYVLSLDFTYKLQILSIFFMLILKIKLRSSPTK